jgi:hypothetical protein
MDRLHLGHEFAPFCAEAQVQQCIDTLAQAVAPCRALDARDVSHVFLLLNLVQLNTGLRPVRNVLKRASRRGYCPRLSLHLRYRGQLATLVVAPFQRRALQSAAITRTVAKWVGHQAVGGHRRAENT